MEKTDWVKKFKEKGALWLFNHDGDQKNPHALLTSGLHSDGFVNSGIIAADALLLDNAAAEVVHNFEIGEEEIAYYSYVDMVVGPAMGAITFSHAIASSISKETKWICLTAFVEKSGDEMVFTRIKPGGNKKILLVEDVITTGGSLEKTEKAVIKAGGEVWPFVLALVNRSGKKEISGKKIYSLIDLNISTWNKEECPLCKAGSEAIRPKENWAKLTGGM